MGLLRVRGGGCGGSKAQSEPADGAQLSRKPGMPGGPPQKQKQSSLDDPRWDSEGFEGYVAMSAPFVKLGFLRSVAAAEPIASESLAPEAVPEKDLHKTVPKDAGVSGVALFAVLSPSLLMVSPDPVAELKAILAILGDDASDDDLVFWSHMCNVRSGDTAAAREGMYKMFTHFRVQTVRCAR